MKISASIYSNGRNNLEARIKELELFNVDCIHIDCNDDISVFDDIRKIRGISDKPIDLHIISSTPEKYFDAIIENRIEIVTFQYEPLKKQLVIPKTMKSKVGLAIMTDTPIEIFDKYLNDYSFVLFMATTPGKSGGFFNRDNFERIRTFKKKNPQKYIHVDGGVNKEVSFILRNMGVYLAVVGSYLLKSVSIGSAMLSLKSEVNEIHYSVKDFMLFPYELPLLEEEDFSLLNALKTIDRSKMGFVIIVSPDQHIRGIVTDGDIRRSLIKKIDNFNDITPEDIITTDPLCIGGDASIEELIEVTRKRGVPALFLPVIDNERKLLGAISFNQLVTGEV
jgi:pentose-5-phosphate-3-epimerase/CBS domain-containing protein